MSVINRINELNSAVLPDPAAKIPETKASSIFKRFVKSPFVNTMGALGMGVGAAFAAKALLAATVVGVTIVPLGLFYVTLGLTAAVVITSISLNKKRLLYEVSLLNTVLGNKINPQNKPWYNEVIPGLFLGAQPMLNLSHQNELPKKGITAVLTMLEEDFEFETTLFTEPVRGEEWTKVGVEQKIIETPDFLPVPQNKIDEAVEFIHQTLEKGGKVYVHCKAGRGRSATAVICYLLKYGIKNSDGTCRTFKSVDEALAFAKEKRDVININAQQRQAIETYFSRR